MTNEALQAAIDDATTRAKMKKVISLTHVSDSTPGRRSAKRT